MIPVAAGLAFVGSLPLCLKIGEADNNHVERALRGVVVGRKDHFCSRSQRGARTTAMLSSLVETARSNDIAQRDYLSQAAKAAVESPGIVTIP